MEQANLKPHRFTVGAPLNGINTTMNKRTSLRPTSGLVNNLADRAGNQSTLSPQDTSIRSDAPLMSDQTMIGDPNMLPGKILGDDKKVSTPANPIELNKKMTVKNHQLDVPTDSQMSRRMTRAVQSDMDQQSAEDPNTQGQTIVNPMNRRGTRAVAFDANQQNPGDPLTQGAPTTNNLNRRKTRMNPGVQQDPLIQGQSTDDPMARRGTRAANVEMMDMVQDGMQLGIMQPKMMQPGMMQPGMTQQGIRPSIMQPHTQQLAFRQMMDSHGDDDGMVHEVNMKRRSNYRDEERLPTNLEHCREPTKFRCTNCNYSGLSKTEYESGCYIWLTVFVTCLCCTPFVYCACLLTKWKDAIHTCPDCGRMVTKVEPPDGTLPMVCCWDLPELCAGDGEK